VSASGFVYPGVGIIEPTFPVAGPSGDDVDALDLDTPFPPAMGVFFSLGRRVREPLPRDPEHGLGRGERVLSRRDPPHGGPRRSGDGLRASSDARPRPPRARHGRPRRARARGERDRGTAALDAPVRLDHPGRAGHGALLGAARLRGRRPCRTASSGSRSSRATS
jgi:hypothetical protein